MSIMQYFNLDSAPLPLAWDPSWARPDVWFDPSDASTVFVGRTGTVPATAGSPVGQIRDKSGKGHHAVAPTDAARPTLTRMPKTGRRNLLNATDTFASGWSPTNVTTALNGTELTVISNAVSGNHRILQSLSLSGSVSGTIEAKAAGYNWLKLRVGVNAYANLNLQTGELGASEGVVVSVPFLTDDGFWRVSVSTSNGSSALLIHGMPADISRNDASYLGDGVSGIIIRNPQLEIDGPSPYQKVTNDFDVTEAGVPDVWYLQGDGIDDALNATIPAGQYTRAFCNADGTVTFEEDISISGQENILRVNQIVGIIYVRRNLTIIEKQLLTAYWKAKSYE